MPIFRWPNALEAFRDLEREMDRLMRSVDSAVEGLRIGRQYPPVNIFELEHEYLVTAELPGIPSEHLEVSVADGLLTLRGSRREADIPEDRYRRSERPKGDWERVIALPERTQEEAVSAELNDGVLRLHLPKTPSATPRKIPITAGQEEVPEIANITATTVRPFIRQHESP